ncbi:hypothetical protein [Streptomyces sp. KL2]
MAALSGGEATAQDLRDAAGDLGDAATIRTSAYPAEGIGSSGSMVNPFPG